MIKWIETTLLLLCCSRLCAQEISTEMLITDVDRDGRTDSIFYDRANTFISCKLSSRNFVTIK